MSLKSIDPKLLDGTLCAESREQWNTNLVPNGMAQGFQFTYDVVDHNFKTNNKWVVLIRVPNKKYSSAGIEIRLEKEGCPTRQAVATHAIWREAIVFNPTDIGVHLDKWYVKVRVKTKKTTRNATKKKLVKRGERSEMPEWLQLPYFSSWIRLKGTVRTSLSGDLGQNVLLTKPVDHLRMIRTFFALRVWSVL